MRIMLEEIEYLWKDLVRKAENGRIMKIKSISFISRYNNGFVGPFEEKVTRH